MTLLPNNSRRNFIKGFGATMICSERRSDLSRAVQEKGEYILPARFDDTEIPSLRHTIGYADLLSRRKNKQRGQ
jgi:hypothetical protein